MNLYIGVQVQVLKDFCKLLLPSSVVILLLSSLVVNLPCASLSLPAAHVYVVLPAVLFVNDITREEGEVGFCVYKGRMNLKGLSTYSAVTDITKPSYFWHLFPYIPV